MITASHIVPHWLLLFGFILSAGLLFKFGWDFSKAYSVLGVPFWLLVGVTLMVSFIKVFATLKSQPSRKTCESKLHGGLIAAIPLGFLVASLGCSGLTARGCTAFCTFIKIFWIPLIAMACLAYYSTRREVFLRVVTGMSLVPIVPHCICYNVVNAWWIDHIGASPECYAWSLAMSVLSVATLLKEGRLWPSLVICYTIIGGALSFFLGHHYFHFPW